MPAFAPRPWHGSVYRHLPAGSPYGPLDTRFAGGSRENRWNRAGEPTLLFASDRTLLIQEFNRHIARDRDVSLAPLYRARQLFQIELQLGRVFDLTDPTTLNALGIEGAPACFSDRDTARATAGFLRHTRHADGLLVPSLLAPGDSTRWNLVVFLDQLRDPLDIIVHSVTPLETFLIDAMAAQDSQNLSAVAPADER